MQYQRTAAGPLRRDTKGFLEICVDTLAGARAAVVGGADQLELCGALALGGLTPSSGLVRAVLAMARPAGVAVRAMIRPRPGDFCYDDADHVVAVAEACALIDDDIDGLVFGQTQADRVDDGAVGRWVAAVRAAPRGDITGLTFHRAIDVVAAPLDAIDTLMRLGFDQILSSGGKTTALAGADTLAAMTRRAGDRCRIVAAAGVTPDTLDALIAHGLRPAVHASARRACVPADETTDPFGFGQAPRPTDTTIVGALRAGVDRHAALATPVEA